MSYQRANAGRTPTTGTGAKDHWKNYYIYMIPAYKKDKNPGAYSPQLASFGPYHNEDPRLQAMEEHKARALDRFLSRSKVRFDECCRAMESSAQEWMSSYQSLDGRWKEGPNNNYKFITLMVQDGVFLYEFMRGYPNGEAWENDYDKEDPVFSVRALRNIPNMVADILMLENQLPLTVLESLIAVERKDLTADQEVGAVENKELRREELKKLVSKFLSPELPSVNISQPLGLHLLDIYRKVITPKVENPANQQFETDIDVKSASNLHDVGVKFKNNEIVSFDNATLSLPPVTFDTTTEPRLLNAIAFECLHPATNHEVSSYIAFMQGLMASPIDIDFLLSAKLIQGEIGDAQAVDRVMRSISKDVRVDRSSDLCKVSGCLNKYHKDNMGKWKRRPREWRRALHEKYFKNPWTIIAVIYAIFIFVLTLLQTIYSMKGK